MAQPNSATQHATPITEEITATAAEVVKTSQAYTERLMLNGDNVTELFTHDELVLMYEAIQPAPKQLRSKAQGIISILETMPDKSTLIMVDLANGDKTDTIQHLIDSLKDAQTSPAVYHCHTAKGKKKGSTTANTAKPLTLAERLAQRQAQPQ